MSILTIQMLAALFIWLISVSGGFAAIYMYKQLAHDHPALQLAEAFAGGIFLGAAFFHMLPDAQIALQSAIPSPNYPFANLVCAAGFCLLLFLEQIVQFYSNAEKKYSINLVPLLLTLLISIHAIIEGVALGVNQQIASILIIFVAIAVHKSSEGFAVGLQLTRGTMSLKTIIILFGLFSLMSPLGVTIGALAREALHGRSQELVTGIFNAFAAGTFLYIATLHKLHHEHHHHNIQLYEFCATLLGLSIMAGVAVWL